MSPIYFFIFLYLITFINNQSINYQLACENIYLASEKDCTVAPWHNDYRCCYITYYENGKNLDGCVYVYDSAESIKNKINEYKGKGRSNVEIECDSNFITTNINLISVIIFFIFYLC